MVVYELGNGGFSDVAKGGGHVGHAPPERLKLH